MHGEALMQDALNSSIQEGVQKVIADHKLRPAMQPSVELGDGYEAGKDAEVKIALEVLPDVPAPAIDGITLERLTVPVDDAAVDAQLEKFASQQKRWDEAAQTHKAKQRSEERRVGQESVSKCRSGWSPDCKKKK